MMDLIGLLGQLLVEGIKAVQLALRAKDMTDEQIAAEVATIRSRAQTDAEEYRRVLAGDQ